MISDEQAWRAVSKNDALGDEREEVHSRKVRDGPDFGPLHEIVRGNDEELAAT